MKRHFSKIIVAVAAILTPLVIGATVSAAPWDRESHPLYNQRNQIAQVQTEDKQTTENETETTTETERGNLTDPGSQRERNGDNVRTTICEKITSRLTTRSQTIATVISVHTDVYTNLQSRLERVVAGASDKGYETSALLLAQNNVNDAVTTFIQKGDDLTRSLTQAADNCATEATYGVTISSARSLLKDVRDSGKDVRTTFKDEVVPALKDYRAWLETNANEEAN